MKSIADQILYLERRLEVAMLDCRAAELRRETSLIETAWATRDGLKAKLKTLKAERDKPREQRRAESELSRREIAEHMARRRAFETGVRGSNRHPDGRR